MYINNRPVASIYRLSIGALATFSFWLSLHIFGQSAWRLFPTWFTLASAIYYVLSALITAFSKKRSSGRVICPAFQGGLIIAGIILAIFHVVFEINHISALGLSDAGMVLVIFLIPVLIFLDWILFTKKGYYRTIDPFYWLALPAIYASWILLSAELTSGGDAFCYPYGFLDFYQVGLDTMLLWLAIIAVVALAFGYLCFILDFTISGKLGKHVVLPHIKTIIIEEPDSSLTASSPQAASSHASSQTRTPPLIKPSSKKRPKADVKANVKNTSSSTKPEVTTSKAVTKTSTANKNKKRQPAALLEANARSLNRKADKTAKPQPKAERNAEIKTSQPKTSQSKTNQSKIDRSKADSGKANQEQQAQKSAQSRANQAKSAQAMHQANQTSKK